jgi:ubiquinone/menaquinone biosynthesis C-methylase UbiE
MTFLVGVVTQEPGFVSWVAAIAVLIFLASAFLLLVVVAGGEGVPAGLADEDLLSQAAEAKVLVESTSPHEVAPTFSETAENYLASMAPSLQMIAEAVVEGAQLRVGERILDAGTSAGFGAAAALSASRTVVGVDPDADMLAIARREVPRAHFVEAEMDAIPFNTDWFNAVVSVHALQFADDPAAVLAEWRRVTIGGGRLSLSVPGPRSTLGTSLYDPVYRRHGMKDRLRVPTGRKLSFWARAAGWQQVKVVADPMTVIRLAGPDAFRRWLRSVPRFYAGVVPGLARSEALERDLLAATPTRADGQLQIPFGTLYLTASNTPQGTRVRPRPGVP